MMEISVVGFGPGDSSLLTQSAVEAINSADIIVGTRHQLDLISNPDAERFELSPHNKTLERVIIGLELGKYNGRVVFLSEGDPGIMSVAPTLIGKFGQDVRIVPGISLVQMAFARLGLSWFGTVMAKAQTPTFKVDRSQVLKSGKLFVYLGGSICFEGVFEFFSSLNDSWKMFVLENLTLPNEKIYEVLHAESCIQLSEKAVAVLVRSSNEE